MKLNIAYFILIVFTTTLFCCSSGEKLIDPVLPFKIEQTENKKIIQKNRWAAAAQAEPHILRTTSPVISVKDGNLTYKDAWTVSPSIKLDEYVTHKFKGKKTVSFYSEIDTVSFDVTINKVYDFVIFNNYGEKSYCRINTDMTKPATLAPKKSLKYYYKNKDIIPTRDSIPFRLGADQRIHITGKMNQSDSLDFVFDTGANCIVINDSIVGQKVQLQLDDTTINKGSGGSKTTPVSSSNRLKIGHMVWDSVRVLSIDYDRPSFDAVLGWVAFENKIVEIDYNKSLLIIHDTLPKIPDGYSKTETKMIGGLPYIKGSITVNNKTSVGWFEFDTGSNGSFNISQRFAKRNQLNNAMKITGTSIASGSTGVTWTTNNHILPQLQLGSFEITQVPITIRSKDPAGIDYLDILGNALLKHFNAIIDLKHKKVYLKPNDINYPIP